MRKVILAMMFAFGAVAPAIAMELTSPDIKNGQPMSKAQVYKDCGGSNISPELHWSGAPKGTNSFALTVIDPDAKPAGWTHWLVMDIPPGATSIARNMGKEDILGITQLKNDFGDVVYGGPCPPAGSGVHHYHFTLWALPAGPQPFREGAKSNEIMAALEKRALAKATITGTYEITR